MDGPRGRHPSSGDRTGRGRNFGGERRDNIGGERRDNIGGERGNTRDGSFQDRAPRFPRREQRPANPQAIQRRTVHYQVVMMGEEDWGDALENRLNTLGHDGWRLVAIDEGRQYVFVQAD